MVSININRKNLSNKLANNVLIKKQKQVISVVKTEVAKKNQELLREFLSHEISKEIKSGQNANSSILENGNLFTFLGFESSSDPIGEIAGLLSKSIKIKNININKSRYAIYITIEVPNANDFNELAKLPWINRNLIQAVEKGISNLGKYLYSDLGFENSRSEKGIQNAKITKSGSLPPQDYLTSIIKSISQKLARDIISSI